MMRKSFKSMGLLAVSVVAAAFMLGGCSDGKNGTNGTNGTNGGASTQVSQLTTDQWSNLQLSGQVTSVSINSPPVIKFKVADAKGNPVAGLGNTTQSATATLPGYSNVSFALAKLIPANAATGAPSRWVSYIVTTVPTYKSATDKTIVPTTAQRPSTDNTGTLVDNGDGTYQYTFYRDVTKVKDVVAGLTLAAPNSAADLDDLTYDPTLPHRLTIQIAGNARGTGTNTANATQAVDGTGATVAAVPMKNPLNIIYDFIPATGKAVAVTDPQREIVTSSPCFNCHGKFTFHGGSRQDTRYCVVCHTDQRKYGYAEATTTATGYSGSVNKVNGFAVGNFSSFIHRLHMGDLLTKTGTTYAGIAFNEIGYPQDIRNCVNCHTSSATTPQGDNWKNNPSRLACGGCHDGIKFSDGTGTTLAGATTGHAGGAAANDSACVTCHPATSMAAYHLENVVPNANNIYLVPGTGNNNTNASNVMAYTNNLPKGAHVITWVINSVTVSAGKPSIKFKFQNDGTDVVFNTFGAKTELMDNFVGSPSIYFAFGVPQDNAATPVDLNGAYSTYLKNVWNGTAAGTAAGTLVGPDASGYYTLTMTGVTIPANAKMVTGGIGYTYGLTNTQPLTQTDVPGYPYNTDGKKQGGVSVPPPNVYMVATGYSARRSIISNAKCNACHAKLGVFTDKVFHAGQRNDGPTCTFCHNANRANVNGWSVNIKDAVHAIHAAGMRSNLFTWEAAAGDQYWTVTYPNILNNCEACHLTGTYDFSATASASAVPNLLWSTAASGNMAAAGASTYVLTKNPTTGVLNHTVLSTDNVLSPFVTAGAAYGAGFSIAAATGVSTPAAATTLVTSPITAACFACHDDAASQAHMRLNGGTIYGARAASINTVEQCLICHGPGATADIKAAHMKF